MNNNSLVVAGQYTSFASPPLRPYSPPTTMDADELPLLFANRFSHTLVAPHSTDGADIISDLLAALPPIAEMTYSTNLFSSPTHESAESTARAIPSVEGELDISNTVEWGSPTDDHGPISQPNLQRRQASVHTKPSERRGGRVMEMFDTLQRSSPGAPLFSLSPGANLNIPPPNWSPGKKDSDRWDPVSSTFAMVDAVARIMEEANYGELLEPRNDRPAHHTFFSAATSVTAQPDVVCPADQLKRILMSTVNGGPLSFVAHRVGASVVIEGNSNPSELNPAKTVAEARNMALKSKLMYFSILANGNDDAPDGNQAGGPHGSWEERSETPRDADPTSNRGQFRKCLHWQFNDLSVMLGVNTPTVALPTHPGKEFTLQFVDKGRSERTRHHDASKGFLTRDEALDLWLDSIMANVDGVALCYHSDGVVEGCQVVSAAHIPAMSVEPFEPIAVQMEARNVLHWLTTACSKEGGSYVVMKDPRDSSLRLYDITFDHAAPEPHSKERHDSTVRGASAPLIEGSTSEDAPHEGIIAGPTHPTTVSTLNDVDDDDIPKSYTSREDQLVQRRKHQLFQAFSFPVALMCLRMAQALPNSDAETLRLLQKSISMLEDGIAITKTVRLQSNGVAAESNDVDISEAERAVAFPLAKAHALCMHHYHSSSPLLDADARCLYHARRCMSHVEEIKHFTTTWTNSQDASTDAKRYKFLCAQEIEVDSIVSGVTRCLGAMANECLKLEERRQTGDSGAIAEVMEVILAYECSISLRSPWGTCQHEGHASIAARNDVAAALVHLDALCGDLCRLMAHRSAAESLTSLAPSTLAHHCGPKKHLSELFRFSKCLPLPHSREALLTVAFDAFHRAATESAELDAISAHPHLRKCAGIAAEKAQLAAQVRGDCSPEELTTALNSAAAYFSDASTLFGKAQDVTNAILMTINQSKMLLRSSMQPRSNPTLQTIEKLNAVTSVQRLVSVEDDVAQERDAPILQAARLHLANALIHCAQHCSAPPYPLGQLSHECLDAIADIGGVVHALMQAPSSTEPVATEGPSQETIVYKLFLLPAAKYARRAGATALESHILLWTYAFHMKYAGLQSLQLAATESATPIHVAEHAVAEKRVASARFALARCRQYATLAAADPLHTLLVTTDLVATYMFLLKNTSVLAACVDPSGAAEVTVDVVERAATSLCTLRPCLEQLQHSPPDAPVAVRAAKVVLQATATVALSLLRLASSGNGANSTTMESLRGIAKEAAKMGASEGMLPEMLTALLPQLVRLDALFSFKTKKQVSKFL